MDKFQKIPYKTFENNEVQYDSTTNNTSQNEKQNLSLYVSAIDNDDNKLIYDVNLNNTSGRLQFTSQQDDNIASFIDSTTESEIPNLNSTFFVKQKRGNNQNKFVNEQTLNSYLSISDLQEDVKENVDICRSTLRKAYERDFKIKSLEEKSEGLLDGSDKFRKTSRNLKRKMYIKYLFNYFAILLVIIIIVFLIIKLT